jgi:hypothetical protein
MRRARDWCCPFDEDPAEHLHHWTGRDSAGRYLDPDLVGPLTAKNHRAEHQVWSALGIADGTGHNPDYLRLRRSGVQLVRLGEHHEGGVVQVPADTLKHFGRMLCGISDRLVPHPTLETERS